MQGFLSLFDNFYLKDHLYLHVNKDLDNDDRKENNEGMVEQDEERDVHGDN